MRDESDTSRVADVSVEPDGRTIVKSNVRSPKDPPGITLVGGVVSDGAATTKIFNNTVYDVLMVGIGRLRLI